MINYLSLSKKLKAMGHPPESPYLRRPLAEFLYPIGVCDSESGTYGARADFALSASSAILGFCNVCTGFGEFVSVLAMCLSGVFGRASVASQYVISAIYGLKVRWIDTIPNHAKMVEFFTLRYGTVRQLIGNTMSAWIFTTVSHVSVALGLDCASPYPTRTKFGASLRDGTVLIDLRPEAFFYRISFALCHKKWPPQLFRSRFPTSTGEAKNKSAHLNKKSIA